MLLTLFPMLEIPTSAMRFSMERLKHTLIQLQLQALQEGKTITIEFAHQTIIIDGVAQKSDLTCEKEIIFHPNGNVNQAMSISCYQDGKHETLVIELGSGRMYVKS